MTVYIYPGDYYLMNPMDALSIITRRTITKSKSDDSKKIDRIARDAERAQRFAKGGHWK